MQISIEQLFRLLNSPKESEERPKTINLSVQFMSLSEINNLPPDINQLYNKIFNNKSEYIDLAHMVPFRKKKTKVPVCNKLLHHHDYGI